MTVGRMILGVAGWGVITAAALAVGLATVGGLMALIHLGLFVGAPLAIVLYRQVRSVPVVIALSIALSFALTALAAQSLIWFGVAGGVALVLTGTAYGCVLAYLLGDLIENRLREA